MSIDIFVYFQSILEKNWRIRGWFGVWKKFSNQSWTTKGWNISWIERIARSIRRGWGCKCSPNWIEQKAWGNNFTHLEFYPAHLIENFFLNFAYLQGANKKMDPLLHKFTLFQIIFKAFFNNFTVTVYSQLTQNKLLLTCFVKNVKNWLRKLSKWGKFVREGVHFFVRTL